MLMHFTNDHSLTYNHNVHLKANVHHIELNEKISTDLWDNLNSSAGVMLKGVGS